MDEGWEWNIDGYGGIFVVGYGFGCFWLVYVWWWCGVKWVMFDEWIFGGIVDYRKCVFVGCGIVVVVYFVMGVLLFDGVCS